MAEAISTKSVVKFDGNDYQGWKFQMRSLFVAHRIWEIVNGTKQRPEAAGPERETWTVENARAMFLLSSTLDPAQMRPLLICETACDMWQRLAALHEQKSSSNKLLLSTRLYEYKMSANDSITNHIAKVNNMAAQLNDVGENVAETTIMAKILGSLTPKYAYFQTAWDNVPPEMQTRQNLEERLLREEARMSANDSVESAFVATDKTRGKNKVNSREAKAKKKSEKDSDRDRDKEKVRCYKCQALGHYASQCKNKSRKKKREGDRDDDDARDCAFVAESMSEKTSSVGKNGIDNVPTEVVRAVLAADKRDSWLTDSGASRHITFRREWLKDFRELPNGDTVSLGNDKECRVVGTGTVEIERYVRGEWRPSRIENVLYVPDMTKNLFSVRECAKKGLGVLFLGDFVRIDNKDCVVGYGVAKGSEIYRMAFKTKCTGSVNEANVGKTDSRVWHERLGHVNGRAMRKLVKDKLIQGVECSESAESFCGSCQEGKSHRKTFRKIRVRAETVPGEVIHTDLCGPMTVESPGGARFLLTFKDDATSFRHVYFLKHKSDVLEKFKKYDKLIENKFGRTMRVLRSDNGLEFKNRAMEEYTDSRGIQREFTAPYTPQQNGKAERDNRTLIESARTMLLAKSLPKFLWAEACSTAVYLMNRAGASSVKSQATPYEMWFGIKPDLKHLRIFGSEAYVNVPKQFLTKLDPRAKKMILVGYESSSSNYRVFDPVTKKITVSRDVTFRETIGPALSEKEGEMGVLIFPKLEEVPVPAERESDEEDDDDECFEQAEEIPDQPREEDLPEGHRDDGRNLRDRASIKRPSRYESNVVEVNIPETYKEALGSREANKWREAIRSELSSHQENETWTLVKREARMNTVDSKWVFRIKNEDDGNRRFKARLCARGFLQKKGVDFFETFSPVVRYDSLRVLLAIVASRDLELAQFDVQTAFLYGGLEEEIFMEPPEGLVIEKGSPKNTVCRLNKSLYGLKQSPRCWNREFSLFLRKYKFQEISADKCIFTGRIGDDTVYLALFVDDGLVAAKNNEAIDAVLGHLKEAFKITVGDASSFVGMQIERDRRRKTIFIHQSMYARKILERFGMIDAKSMSVPCDPSSTLQPQSEEEDIESVPYREAVGSLMFLSIVSRPDISYAVNLVSKFLNRHGKEHWRAVKRIISYVAGTVKYGIEYRSGGRSPILEGYSDADFAGDVETRRSTTGYMFELAGGPVTWASQRQKLVTLSTTEAEYVAASITSREAVWLRRLLSEIECPCKEATTIYVDNQSAIRLVKNPEFHKRTKHIDVRYHFVREKVHSGELSVEYLQTKEQKADIFTKALPKNRFCKLREDIGVQERGPR